MNKLTKGAFAMVLAGAVTFSVTNALLVHPVSKRLAKETAFTITGDQKKSGCYQTSRKTGEGPNASCEWGRRANQSL